MNMQDYAAIMSRITPHRADDIDDLTSRFDHCATAPGGDLFPALGSVASLEPRFKREDAICVGFRMSGEPEDAAERAMRLAAMALERDVEVIILSEDGLAGLERFGFRIERVPPSSAGPRHDWIGQVRRFWGLDLVF